MQLDESNYDIPEDEDLKDFRDVDNYLYRSMYGCAIEYEDYYIVCGISFYERLSFLSNAFFVTVFTFVMIWLVIKWICLVINQRCETAMILRSFVFSMMEL